MQANRPWWPLTPAAYITMNVWFLFAKTLKALSNFILSWCSQITSKQIQWIKMELSLNASSNQCLKTDWNFKKISYEKRTFLFWIPNMTSPSLVNDTVEKIRATIFFSSDFFQFFPELSGVCGIMFRFWNINACLS